MVRVQLEVLGSVFVERLGFLLQVAHVNFVEFVHVGVLPGTVSLAFGVHHSFTSQLFFRRSIIGNS